MHFREKLSQFRIASTDQVQKFAKNVPWKSPRVIGSLSATLVLAGGLSFYLLSTTSVAAVMINGQQMGYVDNVNSGQILVDTFLQEKGEPYGVVAKTRDQIAYENVRIKNSVYEASMISEEVIAESLNYYLEGYKIVADGTPIAYLPSQEDAEKLLKEYEEYYSKASDENQVTSISFAEEVNIEKVSIKPDQMNQVDQAYEMLIEGKVTSKEYKIEKNDSWWLIARKNNMLTEEVLAGNPGTTEDSVIKPGEIINLVTVEPYLTVLSQGTYSGEEIIPYDVVTKTDYKLSPGQTKVITKGNNGSKFVTYSYEQRNGVEVAKKVLDEKVTKKPVDEVVAKGPRKQTTTIAMATSRGSADGSSLVDRALSLQGTSYVFGGTSTSGFDCSGFTKYVYSGAGVSLPRTSYDQFSSGSAVSSDNLQSGDLVFFSTYAPGASHVGIYIGNGKFVHASNPGSGVKVSGISDSYYGPRYLGARRY
ncbi:MAG: NlpC/P60 family protein [Desulfitobacterium sp.]